MELKNTNYDINKKQPSIIYDDDNIPEIDLPKQSNGTNVIPDEIPRRDSPGGE